MTTAHGEARLADDAAHEGPQRRVARRRTAEAGRRALTEGLLTSQSLAGFPAASDVARSLHRLRASAALTFARRRRLVQLALGLLWLGDGLLQLQPFMFGRGFIADVILPTTSGNPAPLTWSTRALIGFVEPHLAVWNALFAGVQIAIGLGLLTRRVVRPALVASFAWALFVWWVGEGLGGLLSGGASPITGAPGAALLYLWVGVLVWPRREQPAGRASVAAGGLLGDRGARATWAAVWLGGAALLLSPVNRAATTLAMAILATAQTAGFPMRVSNALWQGGVALGVHGPAVTLVLAALMALVGAGVALRRYDRSLLLLAVVLAVAIWVIGEGLGGILTGQATDPNTGPLLVLAAAAFYVPRRRPADAEAPAAT